MAHVHELEFEGTSKRIICVNDDCNFCVEPHEILEIVGKCAVQPSVQADDATRTPTTELTITDDRIYSIEATGATPRRR